MNIALVVILSIVALAGALGLGFLLGRRTAQPRGSRPGGKVPAGDRDIVL